MPILYQFYVKMPLRNLYFFLHGFDPAPPLNNFKKKLHNLQRGTSLSFIVRMIFSESQKVQARPWDGDALLLSFLQTSTSLQFHLHHLPPSLVPASFLMKMLLIQRIVLPDPDLCIYSELPTSGLATSWQYNVIPNYFVGYSIYKVVIIQVRGTSP